MPVAPPLRAAPAGPADGAATATGAHVHATGGPARGYRPHLDGLRAVAVYLVVLFHAGIARFSGGFIGVDVFFVLSGYLVTGLLVADLDRSGSIGFARFYARRARRLLPASAVVLVTTAVVFTAVGAPALWQDAEDAIRAAALYVANWFFVARSTDYFAADIGRNPVLHFWSLAVEEQFYVVWPIAFLAVHRLAGRTPRPAHVRRAIAAIGGAASVLWAAHLATTRVTRAYYGTDTRAYQLLAGAFLALSPGLFARIGRLPGARRAGPVVAVGAMAALGLAASSMVDVGPITRGIVATAVTAVLILSLDGVPGGPLGRVLSLPPVVYLGRISYGTYLWHWLVVIVLTRELDHGRHFTAVATLVLSTALAALSYELLEHPIRSWPRLDRPRVAVIGCGLAVSALVGLVVAPTVFDRATPGTRAEAAGSAAVAAGRVDGTARAVDWRRAQADAAEVPTCNGADPSACVTVHGRRPRIMLIGDSHAVMFTPMLEAAARKEGLDLAVAALPACTWLDGALSLLVYDQCKAAQAAWFGPVLDALHPDVVVLSHQTLDRPGYDTALTDAAGGWYQTGSPALDAKVRTWTEATIGELRRHGAKVVIIEPVPQATEETDPLVCLSKGQDTAACRFVYPSEPTAEERLDRRIAARDDDVWSVDMDRALCPYLPICDPVVGGKVVRRDYTHLTASYSASLGGWFADYLTRNGITS